jgi:hypothetical protein
MVIGEKLFIPVGIFLKFQDLGHSFATNLPESDK